MIDRIGIAIQILVERERNALAARVFVHRDEAPRFRVILARPEVVSPCDTVVALARERYLLSFAAPASARWVSISTTC